MGLLVDGVWKDEWYDTKTTKGKFVRSDSLFRNWVTADGSAGPSGEAGFKAEADRYHLYVAMACPWAHRTLIFRKLKNLENIISVSIVATDMLENGWEFDKGADAVNGARYMHEIYTKAEPQCSGRVVVPVLWDKKKQTIVNNESSEIIRMFNSAFAAFSPDTPDYYPEQLRGDIDAINDTIYNTVNNGVYRCGFATSQKAYDEAYDALFASLDMLEKKLSAQRYLMGDILSEADWRLFTTLVRFDSIYYGHFKANKKRIEEYANLSGFVRELYQMRGIADTVDFEQNKRHYYFSHASINPTRIVPKGPDIDFSRPHGREKF